jgi:tetratricopeptide (TPR) repeat protein
MELKFLREIELGGYMGKASKYMRLKKYDEAIELLLEAINHATNIDDNHWSIKLFRLNLAEAYSEIGQYEKAKYYIGQCEDQLIATKGTIPDESYNGIMGQINRINYLINNNINGAI